MRNRNEKECSSPRRFCEATDGPVIRKWYATTRTSALAKKLGLTVKQIMNYVHRHSGEEWAEKHASYRSKINRENGKRGGRPKKKI